MPFTLSNTIDTKHSVKGTVIALVSQESPGLKGVKSSYNATQ